MLCVLIFIHKWRDLQFNVDSEGQIFFLRNFSRQFYFYAQSFLPEICWEEIAEEILFVFCFWCLAWGSNPGFSSNKPTHYLLDHGDFYTFKHICVINKFVWKVKKKLFLSNKTSLKGSRNIKKKYFWVQLSLHTCH